MAQVPVTQTTTIKRKADGTTFTLGAGSQYDPSVYDVVGGSTQPTAPAAQTATPSGASQIAPTPGIASPTPITDPNVLKVKPEETTEQYLARINKARGFTSQQTAGLPIGPPATAPQEPINVEIPDVFDSDFLADAFGKPTSFEDIKNLILQGLPEKREAPKSIVDLYKEQKQALGMEPLETELTRIDSDIERIQTELLVKADEAGEKLVSTRVIDREKGALQKRAEREIALLQVERGAVARQLTNKINSLNTIVSLTGQDYQNSVDYYNQEFSKQMQMIQLVTGVVDRAKDDARANLNVVYNAMQESGKTFVDLTQSQQLGFSQLAAQAGFSKDTFQIFASVKPKAKVLSTVSGNNAAGESIVSFIYDDGTGRPGTVEITKTGGQKQPTGAEEASVEIQNIEKIFEQSKGADGFVSPEVYSREKRRSALIPAQFDQRFATYVNLRDRAGLGITAAESSGGAQFLTEAYFRGIWTPEQLSKTAEDAGFRTGIYGFRKGDVDAYLKNLMKIVEQWRTAGYSDKDIYEQMSKKK